MEGLLVLDYVGTFAFAVFGAYLAQRKGYDIFGVLAVTFISALGGGTMRDILLNRLPIYFYQVEYWILVFLGITFAIVFYKKFERMYHSILAIDAIGLVAFAFVGASQAGQIGLGFFAMVMCAVLTAVGGGILRDVAMRETPMIFYQDFYATLAVFVAVGYFFLQESMDNPWAMYALLAFVFLLRLASIRYNFQLWKPNKPQTYAR